MSVGCQDDGDDDSDLSDYGEETEGRRDALAEPSFMLIGEIFELRGSKYPVCVCRFVPMAPFGTFFNGTLSIHCLLAVFIMCVCVKSCLFL